MEDKNTKLSFLKFLDILQWLFVYNIKLAPAAAIVSALTTIIQTASPLVYAYLLARLLDKAVQIASVYGEPKEVIPILGVLLVFSIFTIAVSSIRDHSEYAMSLATQFKSPQVLYKHLHSLGIQTLENPDVVNKTQRAREVMGMLNNDFGRAIMFFARIVTFVSAALVVVATMPVVVAIVTISVFPAMISNRFHMRKDWEFARSETENKRRANFVFSSLIETSNLQEIAITSAYKYLNGVYKRFADRHTKEVLKNSKSWESFGFLFGTFTATSSIFGYFTILKNLLRGSVSVGVATFQMRSLDMFVNNLLAVGTSYIGLTERCHRINEMKELFDMKPMVFDGSIEMPISANAPNISLKAVSFKYPNSERLVLNDLNLEIKPGEKIAIVGENGAGKTTLVKLLSRFYKVDKGGIYLNGDDINDIKIDSWYKNLGVLFQEYNTYSSLTLKENILLGNSHTEVDKAKMELAASRANVNSFISNFKNGYDQVLSEKFKGGTRPSTGQWQKIAIARFFYRNSPVVIFDEPTASIDAVSEAEIFGQIYEFFKDKTVIIISHRFSTVRNADKIYVLDGGTIAESGTHDQLMKLKGKYHKAFTIQAEGYK